MKIPTKRATSCLAAVLVICVAGAAAEAGQGSAFLNSAAAVSPDGRNELRLEVVENGMAYSVWRNGKTLVEPTRFSLAVEERGTLNGAGAKPEITARKVEGTLATPLYKKSSVDLAANETRVDFGDWAVVLHARNDGVAWRFETKFEGEITVSAESTNIRFPKETSLCYTVAGGFMSGWEKPARIGSVESVPAGHPQIVMTPFAATVPGAGIVCVTESDLRDYPGLNFYRRDGEMDTLRSWQAGVPKEVEKHRRKIKVVSREPYLAKTGGTRVFPWRVFVLGDTPSDLVESDAVYALAAPNSQLTHSSTPHSSTDFSWVKPGQVAWDWWNAFQITDIPGLNTGCNFETYKEYVNFAAANGIAYIIMDEGWAEKLDPEKMRDEVNVPGVIAYAKERGVGVILWAAWAPLTDREKRIRVFDRYAAMGAKGFKIDFIERDDQVAEKFLEEAAADAAERKLVVLYHGIHKPTGLQRTYPNVLNYEGVYGLEQGGSIGGRKEVIANDVNLVYTRMVAGFMDYTPGAMRNRAFDEPQFAPDHNPKACYGTRCHQLALFPMFEAPIQMLCDSPTQYRTETECTAFLTKVPTVWDETRGVAGEIGRFASVARRKDGEWWFGAITNWEARELELPTDFLGEGEWKTEAFEDAPDADKNAERYIRRLFTIKAGEPLKVRLAPGGGFAARLTPAVGAAPATEQLGILTPPPSAAPRINGARVFGVRPGHPILYRLPVTGARPMKFSLTGFTRLTGSPGRDKRDPPTSSNSDKNIKFDPSTGMLSGSIAEPGEYKVTFTAENREGRACRDLVIKVGDKIALTPQMGWCSWNCFARAVTGQNIRDAADALVKTGLADHGWSYVNVDDFWQNNPRNAKDDPTLEGPERTADGTIVPNSRFGDMKAIADYIHSLGLKAGLYSSPGPYTCGGCVGSWGHEWQDAKTYADWGYDYLKYDWCSYRKIADKVAEGAPALGNVRNTLPYFLMGEALAAQDRDILYALCYSDKSVSMWGAFTGGNSWRTAYDIEDTYKSMKGVVERQVELWPYARPGAWNDMDILVVGPVDTGPRNATLKLTRLTPNEQYTHISLWAVLCSPLLIGCDLTAIDDFTLSLLTNDEVIETNQDELGAQAAVVAEGPRAQVWAKPMSDGSQVFALFNTHETDTRIEIDFAALGLEGRWLVRDLWRQTDLGVYSDHYAAVVPGHATHLVRLFPRDGGRLAPGVTDIRMNAIYRRFETMRPIDKPGHRTPKGYPCSECPKSRGM